MNEMHYANAVCAAINGNQAPTQPPPPLHQRRGGANERKNDMDASDSPAFGHELRALLDHHGLEAHYDAVMDALDSAGAFEKTWTEDGGE